MVAILIAPKFQDDEGVVPARVLQEQGADVRYIGLQKGNCSGKGNAVVPVSSLVTEVQPGEFDGLVIPGGAAPETLRLRPEVLKFVKAFGLTGKPIAAICHGPQVLMSANLVRGRKMTCFPGIRDDLTNAGALYLDQEVVVDGNLVTSRTPQDLPAFNKAFCALLARSDRSEPWLTANPTQVLEYAITNEVRAQALYEAMGKQAKDKLSKAKFKYLAEMERSHKETLTELFAKVTHGKSPQLQTIGPEAETASGLDAAGDVLGVLRQAMAAEEAAAKLYSHMAEKVTHPESRRLFQELAEEETRHKHLLESEYLLKIGQNLPSALEKEPWWQQDLW